MAGTVAPLMVVFIAFRLRVLGGPHKIPMNTIMSSLPYDYAASQIRDRQRETYHSVFIDLHGRV